MKSGNLSFLQSMGFVVAFRKVKQTKALSIQLAPILYSIAETAVKTEFAVKVDVSHSSLESKT